MRIVQAVGLAVPKRSGINVRLEAAMRAALQKAQRAGEEDPAILRKLVLRARNDAKKKILGG